MTAGRGCVALTGGTGFLGPHMLSALIAAGWRIRLLARRPIQVPPGVEAVTGSLSDEAALDRLLDGADVLVHAAGLIKAATRADFLRVNRDGSRALAAAAKRQGTQPRVVVVSSLAAREPGLSGYAESKRAGEDAFREAGLGDLAVLRPPAIYGPGDRETAVFLRAADSPVMPIPRVPHGRVTLIHAADVAAAVAALCEVSAHGQTYELSDSRTEGYDWRELAGAILNAAESRAHIVEVPAFVFQAVAALASVATRLSGRAAMLGPGKVRELFHADWSSAGERQPPRHIWRPRIELNDGLTQTIRWLRQTRAA